MMNNMSKGNEGSATTAKKELDQFKLSLKVFVGCYIFLFILSPQLKAALGEIKLIAILLSGVGGLALINIVAFGAIGILSGASYVTATRKDEKGFLSILMGAALSLAIVLSLKGKNAEISIEGFADQTYSVGALIGFGVIGYFSYSMAREGVSSLTKEYLMASMGVGCLMLLIYSGSGIIETADFFYRYLMLVATAYIGIFFGNTKRDKRY